MWVLMAEFDNHRVWKDGRFVRSLGKYGMGKEISAIQLGSLWTVMVMCMSVTRVITTFKYFNFINLSTLFVLRVIIIMMNLINNCTISCTRTVLQFHNHLIPCLYSATESQLS